MGRRAKNKQGPPQPLQEEGPSANRSTGKRKASHEAAGGDNQPRKKLKDASNKTIVSQKSKVVAPNGKGRPQKNKVGIKPQKKVQFAESEDEEGEGWEDVEDEVNEDDLKAQARWAPVQLLTTFKNNCSYN
jgi:ribosomal RNA methyltransferase Nop2